VPCQQGHWFCTKEGGGKNKWRSGANGNAIYQNQEADGQGCCLLVLAVPDQDAEGNFIHTEDENMNLQFLRICQPDKLNKVALDIFTIMAYCSEGGFKADTIFEIWENILLQLKLSNEAVERYMTPIKSAKALYTVQNPRNADDFKVVGHPDAHLWKPMNFVGSLDDENIILLSERHIGKTLALWNMDCVEAYQHGRIYGPEQWTVVVQSIKDSLPDIFFHKLQLLIETGVLTKNMKKYAQHNLACWPRTSAVSSSSSSSTSMPPASIWAAPASTRGNAAPWSPQSWTDEPAAPGQTYLERLEDMRSNP
jgi:hypothetical protein